MKRAFPFVVSILIILLVLAAFLSACSGKSEELPYDASYEPYATPMPHSFADLESITIDNQFQERVRQSEDNIEFEFFYPNIDEIEFTEDRTKAMVWYSLVDKESNTIQPSEPGLSLAVLEQTEDGSSSWKIYFKEDADWYETLKLFPESMVDPEMELFSMPDEQQEAHDGQVYTGYRLPWPAGRAVRVSGSVGHVYLYKSCPNTCRYAYDFADGTMFPVVAAKGGTVKYVVWQYPNGNTKHANYIVLEDTTTTPTTYMVYYHLAQDSVPAELRVPGAVVVQGQYLGNADDTGYSSGHHLHFHVHTNSGSVWGTSVDIVFDDVDVNGGRPRTSYEAQTFPKLGTGYHKGNWFVSQNGDSELPTGKITSPKDMDTISTRYLTVKGSAQDDYGVAYLQLLATYDGTWFPVGPLMKNTPFETSVDLCESGIPNGTFFVSLQVIDTAGKKSDGFPGLVKLEKKYACPLETTDCAPGVNQAGLYSSTTYGGACMVMDYGKYSEDKFSSLLVDGVQSIKLGSQSIAHLYADPNFEGEKYTLLTSDEQLLESELGFAQVKAIEILAKPAVPVVPVIHQPRNARDLSPTIEDEVIITWDADTAVESYSWELSGPDGYLVKSDNQNVTTFNAGLLGQGEYLFLLTAKNVVGSTQNNIRFSVQPPDDPSQTSMNGLAETTASTAINLSWNVEAGGDDLDHFEMEIQTDGGEWQIWERPLVSQLRQAWYIGEPGKSYAFRIRSVDIAGNVEEYPTSAEVFTTIESSCTADEYETAEKESALVQASLMEVGDSQVHNLCGAGDEDWITFPANAGENLQIQSTPHSGAAATVLQVYRSDRYSKVAEVYPVSLNDTTSLEWTADTDGVYFLRVLPLDQKIYGTDSSYEIRLNRVGEKPTSSNYLLPAMILPFLWFVVKIISRVKVRKSED
jgi:murein DD-endopeptidase MepM/ murein hydrolase activator NlpD